MKARITELVAALRAAGVRVSVAEAIDAAAAAAAVGVARTVLRDALAATLVKDARDLPLFDDAFDRVFPPRPPGRERTRSGRRAGQGAGGEGRGGAAGATARAGSGTDASAGDTSARADETAPGARRAAASPRDDTATHVDSPHAVERATARSTPDRHETDPPARGERTSAGARERADESSRKATAADGALRLAHARRERQLLARPFRAMTARDVEDAADLVRSLARRFKARLRRRLAPRARGRLDFRRTLRAAVPRGGTPFERRYRGRRPGKPVLVALCDLSASTAVATDFFLALLAPACEHFARAELFGFVDRLVEIEFVAGRVQPAAPIDLMARSDFGRVLADLTSEEGPRLSADTILLVLGDARNNRRPPRADLLARARARVRRLVWLNPEPTALWNTGDSAIASYARHADVVVPCASLAELDQALAAIVRS
jgi:uncharacterized protein with von Willebrand factor type A (vWA) domain